MTHPALTQLSLDEIRRRGVDARRLGLPFNSNPFYMDLGDDLEAWYAKCSAWADGWAQRDSGRTPPVITLLNGRFAI